MCWDGDRRFTKGSTVRRLLDNGCDGGYLMIEKKRKHLPQYCLRSYLESQQFRDVS